LTRNYGSAISLDKSIIAAHHRRASAPAFLAIARSGCKSQLVAAHSKAPAIRAASDFDGGGARFIFWFSI
jgi:hypothetical protein